MNDFDNRQKFNLLHIMIGLYLFKKTVFPNLVSSLNVTRKLYLIISDNKLRCLS